MMQVEERPGFFNAGNRRKGEFICLPCPPGAFCRGELDVPLLLPGYSAFMPESYGGFGREEAEALISIGSVSAAPKPSDSTWGEEREGKRKRGLHGEAEEESEAEENEERDWDEDGRGNEGSKSSSLTSHWPQDLEGSFETSPLRIFWCRNSNVCPGGFPGVCGNGRDPSSVGCAVCPVEVSPERFVSPYQGGECQPCQGNEALWFWPLAILLVPSGYLLIYTLTNGQLKAQATNLSTFRISTRLLLWITQVASRFLRNEKLRLSHNKTLNTLGAIFSTVYTSVAAVGLSVFGCVKHPAWDTFLSMDVDKAFNGTDEQTLQTIRRMQRDAFALSRQRDANSSLISYPQILCGTDLYWRMVPLGRPHIAGALIAFASMGHACTTLYLLPYKSLACNLGDVIFRLLVSMGTVLVLALTGAQDAQRRLGSTGTEKSLLDDSIFILEMFSSAVFVMMFSFLFLLVCVSGLLAVCEAAMELQQRQIDSAERSRTGHQKDRESLGGWEGEEGETAGSKEARESLRESLMDLKGSCSEKARETFLRRATASSLSDLSFEENLDQSPTESRKIPPVLLETSHGAWKSKGKDLSSPKGPSCLPLPEIQEADGDSDLDFVGRLEEAQPYPKSNGCPILGGKVRGGEREAEGRVGGSRSGDMRNIGGRGDGGESGGWGGHGSLEQTQEEDVEASQVMNVENLSRADADVLRAGCHSRELSSDSDAAAEKLSVEKGAKEADSDEKWEGKKRKKRFFTAALSCLSAIPLRVRARRQRWEEDLTSDFLRLSFQCLLLEPCAWKVFWGKMNFHEREVFSETVDILRAEMFGVSKSANDADGFPNDFPGGAEGEEWLAQKQKGEAGKRGVSLRRKKRKDTDSGDTGGVSTPAAIVHSAPSRPMPSLPVGGSHTSVSEEMPLGSQLSERNGSGDNVLPEILDDPDTRVVQTPEEKLLSSSTSFGGPSERPYLLPQTSRSLSPNAAAALEEGTQRKPIPSFRVSSLSPPPLTPLAETLNSPTALKAVQWDSPRFPSGRRTASRSQSSSQSFPTALDSGQRHHQTDSPDPLPLRPSVIPESIPEKILRHSSRQPTSHSLATLPFDSQNALLCQVCSRSLSLSERGDFHLDTREASKVPVLPAFAPCDDPLKRAGEEIQTVGVRKPRMVYESPVVCLRRQERQGSWGGGTMTSVVFRSIEAIEKDLKAAKVFTDATNRKEMQGVAKDLKAVLDSEDFKSLVTAGGKTFTVSVTAKGVPGDANSAAETALASLVCLVRFFIGDPRSDPLCGDSVMAFTQLVNEALTRAMSKMPESERPSLFGGRDAQTIFEMRKRFPIILKSVDICLPLKVPCRIVDPPGPDDINPIVKNRSLQELEPADAVLSLSGRRVVERIFTNLKSWGLLDNRGRRVGICLNRERDCEGARWSAVVGTEAVTEENALSVFHKIKSVIYA
uniref:Uncharacterized protein n=1 Tax=Chromera velia CCMP2878 TaxID=1169474 RepID=A0A0G4GM46_9ALVE|eukprot:Cvel_4907.t1-p1 / transcript=Cvel_4907.t1 / gene=Cvel_4907 / organism=Chromera_velia_CCMP2878 / gene_product=hypothetical protein / transcript_product=hypothetical protein / location=Cvel_scaffold221:55562-65890(+) / protein_length=1431 / sequence_SO=supercontig / SO=protein_coding / is_pseudo=false